jgi:hypothetical protein
MPRDQKLKLPLYVLRSFCNPPLYFKSDIPEVFAEGNFRYEKGFYAPTMVGDILGTHYRTLALPDKGSYAIDLAGGRRREV